MYFSSIHQHYEHGHFPGSLPLRQFFHRPRFSPVQIIYFGRCLNRVSLVIPLDIMVQLQAGNDKIYSNKDSNLQEIICLADVESTIWMEAQLTVNRSVENPYRGSFQHATEHISLENTRICYIYGSWKEEDIFTRQGWFYRQNSSTDVILGVMNLRRGLLPLHVECESLIQAMKCMKIFQFFDVVFATDYSQQVKMVQMMIVYYQINKYY